MLLPEYHRPCNRRTSRLFWSSSGARLSAQSSFVAPLSKFHILKYQRLHNAGRSPILAVELPSCDMTKFIIITKCLPIFGLVFNPEMTSTRFIAFICVQTHQFRKFQKIGNPSGVFQRLAEILAVTEDVNVLPKLLANLGNLLQRL